MVCSADDLSRVGLGHKGFWGMEQLMVATVEFEREIPSAALGDCSRVSPLSSALSLDLGRNEGVTKQLPQPTIVRCIGCRFSHPPALGIARKYARRDYLRR